eukprot:3029750-Pyramimonas_sp.AAC.1
MAFLVEQLSSLFKLRLAFNKFAIFGTSAELVELAQSQLGQYAGEFNHSIINLGVDFAPGKTKSRPQAKAKRKERWRKGRSRLAKIRSLKNPKRSRAK